MAMVSFITKAPRSRRTLLFGSTMHVWSDLFFALLVPLLPFIKEDMGPVVHAGGNAALSVFSGASAILQVPAGLLAESAGEFWMLILGNVWVSAGLIAMALSQVFMILVIVSGVGGLGGGTQHPLASSMVSRAYDDRGRATAVGTVNFAGDLGKMLAPLVAGLFAVRFGWRETFMIVGISGLVFMLASMFTRRAVDIGSPSAGSGEASAAESGEARTDDDSGARVSGFITLSGVGVLDSAVRTSALVFLPFVMDAKDMGPGPDQRDALPAIRRRRGGQCRVRLARRPYEHHQPDLGYQGTDCAAAGRVACDACTADGPADGTHRHRSHGTSSVLYRTVANLVPPDRRARFYGFFYTTNEIGTVAAPLAYGLVADLFSLNTTMIVMGVATAAILPASLTLRRHLRDAGF